MQLLIKCVIIPKQIQGAYVNKMKNKFEEICIIKYNIETKVKHNKKTILICKYSPTIIPKIYTKFAIIINLSVFNVL